MYILVKVDNFVSSLANVLCEAGVVKSASTGCDLVRRVMDVTIGGHAPTDTIRVDCGVLRRALIHLCECEELIFERGIHKQVAGEMTRDAVRACDVPILSYR